MAKYKEPRWWLGVFGVLASIAAGSGALPVEGPWVQILAVLTAIGSMAGTMVLRPNTPGAVEKFPPQ